MADRVAHLKGLQHYERVLRAAWDGKIAQLRRARKLEQDNYEASAADLERQFAHLRVHFDKTLDANIEAAKHEASEAAISCQPVADRIKYQDNGWLHQEFDKHDAEHHRLRQSCEALQQEYEALSVQFSTGQGSVGGRSFIGMHTHSRPRTRFQSAGLPRQTSAPTLRNPTAQRTRGGCCVVP